MIRHTSIHKATVVIAVGLAHHRNLASDYEHHFRVMAVNRAGRCWRWWKTGGIQPGSRFSRFLQPTPAVVPPPVVEKVPEDSKKKEFPWRVPHKTVRLEIPPQWTSPYIPNQPLVSLHPSMNRGPQRMIAPSAWNSAGQKPILPRGCRLSPSATTASSSAQWRKLFSNAFPRHAVSWFQQVPPPLPPLMILGKLRQAFN